jgi:Transposase DDE domain
MDTIKLIARNGDAVRDGIELGDIVHMATASEELTDEFLLFAIKSGLLQQWAQGFPDPRKDAEIGMDVILAAALAARFAGIYSLRKMGYVLQSALVLGELGYSVEVIEAGQGISRRGTGDAQVISGDVLRKLLVQMEQRVTLSPDALAGEVVDTRVGRVRERGSRRAVKGPVDGREAQGRGRGVGEQITEWYTQCVGASLLAYAQVGAGRRLHIVDCTKVEVPLDSGHYECSGVVKNEDGSLARGYKLATIRTLLDMAGVFTQVAVAPIQVHDVEVCRSMLLNSPALRGGDLLLEDNGFMDGALIAALKHQRQVDVIVPLRSKMVAFDEAVRLAEMTGKWQSHPSRAAQQIAFVPGVHHVWDTCTVPLNACVIRYWHTKKHQHAYIVLVTTDQKLTAKWIVKHYEQRPEIEQDYEQMKSGGWKLQKLSSTRYSEIVFYLVSVLLSYSLYHLFTNTHAGTHFANKTRQAIALEQLQTQRTHVIVYAGGYFEIFETLTFIHLVLGLPTLVQERLRLWLDEHLNHIEKRE